MRGAHAAAPSRRRPRDLPFDWDGPRVAIVGGKVLVGDGTVVEGGTVELRGARIVRVGTGAPQAGADLVVDASGKVVTPGFIAAQSQVGLVEIEAERSTRDLGRDDEHPIRAAYDVAPAVHAGSSLVPVTAVEGVTTTVTVPRGGVIAGQGAVLDMVAWDHRGIVGRPRVVMVGSLGRAYAGSRAATLALVRRTLEDARFYLANRRAYDRRALRDLAAAPADLAALGPVLAGRMPLALSAHRASDILAAIELGRAFGLRVVVVGGAQAWQVADALAEAKVPVVLQPSHNLPGSIDHLGATMENAARLHAAGVEIGIAVLDEGHNVRNVTQEAGIAVAAGLPYDAAIRAMSGGLARIYGIDDAWGTLAEGKVANVAVWPDDPLELSSWPEAVFVHGRALPMESRQTRLRDRYLSRLRPGER
ncbi:MAG: hypothetical protein D6705_02665 [Deltaproteobacteria bacterium]|nr:MAG: hypothetical protein D6705_02665 [Deltaproteobacteria bacterium]